MEVQLQDGSGEIAETCKGKSTAVATVSHPTTAISTTEATAADKRSSRPTTKSATTPCAADLAFF